MKKKISLLLALVMVFSIVLTGCGSDDPNGEVVEPETELDDVEVEEVEGKTLDEIVESGKLVLGTSADYPPFEFHAMIDGKDEIAGLDIEIAKYIADELGVDLEIKDMDFDKLLGDMAIGRLDIVIAGMNPDPKRNATFSDIYYEANLSVLVPKDSQIATIEDLDGKSIGVQMGTVQEEIAQESINDADVRSLSKNPEIIMNLKTNKIDCAIMETPVAESFAKVNDDIMLVKDLVIDNESGGVAVAVKEGNNELIEKINEILAEIKEQGLIEEWLVEADELSTKDLD